MTIKKIIRAAALGLFISSTIASFVLLFTDYRRLAPPVILLGWFVLDVIEDLTKENK